ncbi:metal ABC transporter permease [Candidatus Uabimicrobium amorphum]|uniref:Manganese ABC transporter permease n=1 Tax=Uabimicrobium amorphum TaxID=2596890 RepID=A0A5S9IU08_UABAM|nr:iron chelate uptake ABC transporter family permease subunit [Candidatus Uabimicrobium amorphum]BBM87616.1 manganese ABC transporter permease [Candidatus Uabimicrobium amorphum]
MTLMAFASFEIWIMVIGALVCSACGILGCFLILKKLALMGDAISHAVLPGIVVAVMLSGSLNSIAIFVGAGIIGVLTPILVDSLKSSRLIDEDAAIGSVFTFLFAIGVIMVANAGNIDLDTECVLYGEIATTPFDTWVVGGTPYEFDGHTFMKGGTDIGPKSAWTLGIVLLINILFIFFFYKELKISTFDPALALSMGLKPKLIHYLLMFFVAITTIASFEAVGAIIVVAMFIAPGASAYLLTDRLSLMIFLSGIVGAASSVLGYMLALALGGDVSIAGCMAVAAGGIFAMCFFFSPKYGVVVRFARRYKLKKRFHAENALVNMYRTHELGERCLVKNYRHNVIVRFIQQNILTEKDGELHLTEFGTEKAQNLMRAHRLWEAYIHKLGLPEDHVHQPADEMEHYLTNDLCTEIAQELKNPQSDPHGKPIPTKPAL